MADLSLVEDSEPPEPPTVEEQLAAIPGHIALWPEVDLHSPDPAWSEEAGRRLCIATRRAGGRCTAPPLQAGLLCTPHAGRLDSVAGGHAKAKKLRDSRSTAEERAAWARLGTRGVIAARLAARADAVAATVDVLLDAASSGDLASAKLLVPYLNQGLGLPTERVQITGLQDGADLAAMRDEELQALVARAAAQG